MHADDQHFLVVGSVEDADAPAFRQIARGAPEKIVLQFGGAGMLEAEYLAALRVDPGHHVPDGAVLSRRIHRLKDQQDGVAVGRVEKLLLRAQLRDVLFQKLLVLLLRLVHGLHGRRPLLEVDLVSFPHAKILGIDFHFDPFSAAGRKAAVGTPLGTLTCLTACGATSDGVLALGLASESGLGSALVSGFGLAASASG